MNTQADEIPAKPAKAASDRRMRDEPGGRVALVIGAALVAFTFFAFAAPNTLPLTKRLDSSPRECKKSKVTAKVDETARPAVRNGPTITSQQGPMVINYGAARGVKSEDLIFVIDNPNPKTVNSRTLTVAAPRRLRRVDTGLPTTLLARPSATPPVFNKKRTSATTTICFNSHRAAAGSYVGDIVVGTSTANAATVGFTVNVKNGLLAMRGIGVALLLALMFIVFKEKTRTATAGPDDGGDPDRVDDRWGWQFGILECLVPLGLAGWAAYQSYLKSPAWGADEGTAFVALLGVALAAAGLRSVATVARK